MLANAEDTQAKSGLHRHEAVQHAHPTKGLTEHAHVGRTRPLLVRRGRAVALLFPLALLLLLYAFLLEARLGDREEEGAVKAILLAMLAYWRLCIRQHVASRIQDNKRQSKVAC